jgi:hypothetical protein
MLNGLDALRERRLRDSHCRRRLSKVLIARNLDKRP